MSDSIFDKVAWTIVLNGNDYRVTREVYEAYCADTAKNSRAIELLRACNRMGGVVVEYYPASGNNRRPLRDLITEYLNEVDGKVATK